MTAFRLMITLIYSKNNDDHRERPDTLPDQIESRWRVYHHLYYG